MPQRRRRPRGWRRGWRWWWLWPRAAYPRSVRRVVSLVWGGGRRKRLRGGLLTGGRRHRHHSPAGGLERVPANRARSGLRPTASERV